MTIAKKVAWLGILLGVRPSATTEENGMMMVQSGSTNCSFDGMSISADFIHHQSWQTIMASPNLSY